jgi:hypothetical protein
MNEQQKNKSKGGKYVLNSVAALVAITGVAAAYFFLFQPQGDVPGLAIDADSAATGTISDADLAQTTSSPSFDPQSLPSSPQKAPKKSIMSVGDIKRGQSNTINKDEVVLPSANPNDNSALPDSSTIISSSTALGDASSGTAIINVPAAPCTFPSNLALTNKKIILNEVAWMGSVSSKDEWMELKNISGNDMGLAGWELADASGKIKISFSDVDRIPVGGFMILSRATGTGKIYSGDLLNGGDILAVIDPQCAVSDSLDASQGWPGGNNNTKQTLERNADGSGWHTSASPGGTPRAENSQNISGVNSSSAAMSVATTSLYKLIVAFEGDGAGSVSSSQPGFLCATLCSGSYPSGTIITLTPAAGKNSSFNSWSGLCYGQTSCTFTMAENISIAADFRLLPGVSPVIDTAPADVPPSPSPDPSPSSSSSLPPAAVAPGHLLIVAVQIAGASSTNDFVKIANPTASSITIGGWKLRKRSETGTDYSLKQFSAGASLAPGQSLMWANSAGGYSALVGAAASSSETLAVNNSVGLIDSSGTIIDAVAWGSGAGQYVLGSPYFTNPAANQVLTRQMADGTWNDTGNNANDFILK